MTAVRSTVCRARPKSIRAPPLWKRAQEIRIAGRPPARLSTTASAPTMPRIVPAPASSAFMVPISFLRSPTAMTITMVMTIRETATVVNLTPVKKVRCCAMACSSDRAMPARVVAWSLRLPSWMAVASGSILSALAAVTYTRVTTPGRTKVDWAILREMDRLHPGECANGHTVP